MSRAVIALLLVLQSPAARHTLEATRARAEAEPPSQQVEVTFALGTRHLGAATLLYAGGASHLAAKGPFGGHGAVVRVAHGMVGLERASGTDLLAPDAVMRVREALGDALSPEALMELVLGRVPPGAWSQSEAGWTVVSGRLVCRVDRDGQLLSVAIGHTLELERVADGWELAAYGQVLRIGLGARVERAIPASAFTLSGRLL